jgi:acyl carrier protein
MCIRAGNDELDTVKALMSMSLNSLVADVFGLDPDEIDPELELRRDLHMDPAKASALRHQIADFFDGLQVNLRGVTTLGELFARVIEQEFSASLTIL